MAQFHSYEYLGAIYRNANEFVSVLDLRIRLLVAHISGATFKFVAVAIVAKRDVGTLAILRYVYVTDISYAQ